MTRETVYLSFLILLSISLCLLTNISPFLNQDTLSKEVFNLTEVFRSVSDLNKEFLFKWGLIMLIYSSKLLFFFFFFNSGTSLEGLCLQKSLQILY